MPRHLRSMLLLLLIPCLPMPAMAAAQTPVAIAATLAPSLPVLVLQGEKDSQVTVPQVEHLMAGFSAAGNGQTRVDSYRANQTATRGFPF